MILRAYCVDWIIGWVACWIAFKSVFFTLEKLVLKASSTPPRYLLNTSLSVEILQLFLIAFRQLLDTWWIDRESSCLLDSFSTLGGLIELLFLDLMSCSSIPQLSTTISSIPTSIASSIPASIKLYWGSIYSFFVIRFSFLRSLSICPHLFISQTLSLSLQTSSFVIIQAFSRFFFSW